MEQDLKKISEKRFSLIFKYANLGNQGNLRDVIHKTDMKINADLEFHQSLHKRTLELKKRMTTANIILT